jgi:hypothetical protein
LDPHGGGQVDLVAGKALRGSHQKYAQGCLRLCLKP